MTPTAEQTEAPPNPTSVSVQKYTDEDALNLGLPTPGAMNVLKVWAREMTGTPFFPPSLGSNPNTILAVVMTGREMGLSPMQSMRSYWLSPDGRLGQYADSMLAIMRKNNFRFDWHQADADGCDVTGKRPDGDSFRSTFTVADAKAAGLWDKGNVWKKYPADMCRNRAIGRMFRTLASDFGGSQMYTKEELEDSADFATGSDQARADVLAGQDDVIKVGRKPKAAAPVETAAPAADTIEVKSEAVAEPTKSDIGQTKEAAPEAVKEETAAEAYARRTMELTDLVAEKSPTLAKKDFVSFFKGFFGVDKLSAIPADRILAEAFPALESTLKDNKDMFLRDPSGMGRVAGVGKAEADGKLATYGWTPALQQKALELAKSWSMTVTQLDMFFGVNGVKEMKAEDVDAFLRFALMVPNDRSIDTLVTILQTHGIGPLVSVQEIEHHSGKPLEQMAEADITMLITKALEGLDAKKNAPAAEEDDDGPAFA